VSPSAPPIPARNSLRLIVARLNITSLLGRPASRSTNCAAAAPIFLASLAMRPPFKSSSRRLATSSGTRSSRSTPTTTGGALGGRVPFSVRASRRHMPETARLTVSFTSFGSSSTSTNALPKRMFFRSGHSASSCRPSACGPLVLCSNSLAPPSPPSPKAQLTGSCLDLTRSGFMDATSMMFFGSAMAPSECVLVAQRCKGGRTAVNGLL